jgi:hypothetical protein
MQPKAVVVPPIALINQNAQKLTPGVKAQGENLLNETAKLG